MTAETMAREIVRKHVGFLQVETQQRMIDEITGAMRTYGAQMVLDALRDGAKYKPKPELGGKTHRYDPGIPRRET